MIFFHASIFIIACLVLARSGSLIVQALTRIARFLGWREFVVASLLMAFTTSLPEFFVGISSAFHQKANLSFSNIIGSNIAVLTLIVGLSALTAKKLKFEGKALQRCSFYAPFIASLPLVLMMDSRISRIDGIILLLTAAIYFRWLIGHQWHFTKIIANKNKDGKIQLFSFLKDIVIFAAGILFLLMAAETVVWSALNLAKELKLSLIVIGLFLVSLGTSIPELAFGMRSVKLGHKEMVLGDAMGSVVINSSLILGITALISPFNIPNFSPYFSGILFTVITALLFTIFAKTDREITEREAIALLFIYILFVVTELFLNTIQIVNSG